MPCRPVHEHAAAQSDGPGAHRQGAGSRLVGPHGATPHSPAGPRDHAEQKMAGEAHVPLLPRQNVPAAQAPGCSPGRGGGVRGLTDA